MVAIFNCHTFWEELRCRPRDFYLGAVFLLGIFNGAVMAGLYIDVSEMLMLMFTCQELASKSSNHAAFRTFAFPSNFLSLASCFSGIDSEYGFPDFKMW